MSTQAPRSRPSLLLTSLLLPSSPAEQRPSLGDRQNVLAVGVPGEAGGAERSPVEDPVQDLFAALAVLVSQQGVHEGVGRGLAVGQALGQHPPVGADGYCRGQLHQPVGGDREDVGLGKHSGAMPSLRPEPLTPASCRSPKVSDNDNSSNNH